MIKQEWKNIFKKPLLIGIIFAVMLVPMFYSLIFLSAYWNPYGKTNQLHIAIVNHDKGAKFEDKTLNVGKSFVDELKDNDKFQWELTNKEKALKGLKKEDYYMVIEIPEDFSKNASSLLDPNPKKMKLNYYTDAGKNYSGSQISNTAIKDINASISQEVTEQYANSVFDSFKEVGDGMQKASDGAKKLNTGVTSLADGTATLNTNLKKLAESTVTFEKGTSDLKNGQVKLTNGIKQSAIGAEKLNEGLNTLQTGASSLSDGTTKLSGGLDQLNDASGQLGEGSSKLVTGTSQINDGIKQALDGSKQLQSNMGPFSSNLDAVNQSLQSVTNEIGKLAGSDSISKEDLQKELVKLQTIAKMMDQLNQGGQKINAGTSQLVEGQKQLYTGSSQLLTGQQEFQSNFELFNHKLSEAAVGAKKLSEGTVTLVEGTKQLHDGSKKLSTGLNQLNTGGNQLLAGLNQLSDGTKQLSSGSNKLSEGSEKLLEGTNKISDGTNELHHSLQDGANKVNDVNTTAKTDKMFASPTQLEAHKLNNIKNYGSGLAPYILSIGLFAGGLMFVSAYPIREISIQPTTGFSWFFSKYSVLMLVGIFQAIIADLVLFYGLGLKVGNEWSFILFTIFTSLVLLAIIQFLVVTLGNAGQYLIFILMLLQIGGSAGTFPIDLTPKFFQDINPFLPLTYSIKGFRELMNSTIDYSFVWDQVLYLGIFGIAFVLLTNLILSLKVKKISKQEVQATN